MNECIRLTREGAVAHVRFQRSSSLNSINSEMAHALLSASREIAADSSVRAVILSGEGRGFMAGGDLAAMRSNPGAIARDIIDPLHAALQILAANDAPVIASVHGVCAGAGISLLLAADYAIAAQGTRFNLAYASIGASCDGGASFALPRVVGLRRALEIALLSDPFESEQALKWSLVNRVVPMEALADEAADIARRLAAGPTLAYGSLRRLMRRSFDATFSEQLDAERAAFVACAYSDDFAEGLQAFFEKRSACFLGGARDE